MSILRFKALHLTANGNVLLEPVQHKEPIAKKMQLKINGERAAEIFDTIANIDKPLYLAKPLVEIQSGVILQGELKK